ncbi:MAG: hypothetical protein IJ193_00015 [Bacilli bacterium]|nr:hypothetical protein [Bacilli bacterium]
MSKKDKSKDIIEVKDAEVVEFEEDDDKSLFEFIAEKLSENLSMDINIKKNKKTGKIGLSFSVDYDDEE